MCTLVLIVSEKVMIKIFYSYYVPIDFQRKLKEGVYVYRLKPKPKAQGKASSLSLKITHTHTSKNQWLYKLNKSASSSRAMAGTVTTYSSKGDKHVRFFSPNTRTKQEINKRFRSGLTTVYGSATLHKWHQRILENSYIKADNSGIIHAQES